MNNPEIRRLEMLTRVRDFGESRAAVLPPTSHAGQLFATVSAVVNELEEHAGDQASRTGATRENTTTKAVARAALIEALEAINLTARAMSLTTPGLDDQFRLPRSHSDQTLVAIARAFAEDAVAWKPQFVLRELPETFIEDLTEDIAEFEQAVRARNVSNGSQVAATAAIDEAIDRGMRAAQELNAIVQNKLRNNKPDLAAWTSARHVERAHDTGARQVRARHHRARRLPRLRSIMSGIEVRRSLNQLEEFEADFESVSE